MLNKPVILLFIAIIFAHSFILTRLIFFPYPELFIYPYLTNQALLPYKQILDQHFPGLMFLPVNFNNLGMTTPDVARIWLISVVILVHFLLFFISRDIFKSNKKAILVNLLYLIWQPFFEGWVLWIDSFLPLILLPAFYALHKRWIFLTGLLLGIGVVFKQVLAPLSGLVLIYLIWERKEIRERRAIRWYLFGLSLPVILMIIYLSSIGVLKDFWYWTVIFNLTVFAKYGRKFAPTLGHILRIAIVFGMSGLVLKFWNERIVKILIIFLLGALATAISRFDFVHFQPALPFAILATVYGLEKVGWLGRLGIVGYILVTIWWLVIFYKGHIGDKIFFYDSQTYVLAEKVKQQINTGEKIFVFGALPHLYQMTGTIPAGDIFVFQFPWFMMVAQDRILEGIKKDHPQIIVSDRTVQIEGLPITDFAKKIDQYIQKNYQPIDQVGTTVILRRKSF